MNRFAVPVSILTSPIELSHGLKHLNKNLVGLLTVNPLSDYVFANLTGPDIAISDTQGHNIIESFEKSFVFFFFWGGEGGGRGCRRRDLSSDLL